MTNAPIDFDDPTLCPLCGAENRCAVAAGRPAETCWCMTVAMDPETLVSIPEAAQGKVCICPRCAGAGVVAPDTEV